MYKRLFIREGTFDLKDTEKSGQILASAGLEIKALAHAVWRDEV